MNQTTSHSTRSKTLVPLSLLLLAVVSSGCSQTPLEELTSRLSSSEVSERYAAAKSLESLGPEAAPASRALADALQDPEQKVRYRAAKALSKIGPGAVEAVSGLSETLSDDDVEVRYYVAKAIAEIGSPAKECATKVAHALEQEKEQKVRRVLTKALYELETTSPQVVPALQAAISDSDADVSYYAVMAMSRMGRKAKAAVPALRTLANQSDERLKQAAELALERIK